MRRLTAAVLATAAVDHRRGDAVSGAVHTAVRAEVVVAGEGHPLDVRRIRIVDCLRPGESYRLPTFSIRNHRRSRTAYRPVVSAGAARGGKAAAATMAAFRAGRNRDRRGSDARGRRAARAAARR